MIEILIIGLIILVISITLNISKGGKDDRPVITYNEFLLMLKDCLREMDEGKVHPSKLYHWKRFSDILIDKERPVKSQEIVYDVLFQSSKDKSKTISRTLEQMEKVGLVERIFYPEIQLPFYRLRFRVVKESRPPLPECVVFLFCTQSKLAALNQLFLDYEMYEALLTVNYIITSLKLIIQTKIAIPKGKESTIDYLNEQIEYFERLINKFSKGENVYKEDVEVAFRKILDGIEKLLIVLYYSKED